MEEPRTVIFAKWEVSFEPKTQRDSRHRDDFDRYCGHCDRLHLGCSSALARTTTTPTNEFARGFATFVFPTAGG